MFVLPSAKRILRVSGVCGVITPLLVLTLIAIAITYSPWFSWTENALSDLGVPYKNATIPATLFNSSLIIGGFLTLIFTVGLLEVLPRRISTRTGAYIFASTAFAMSAIGIFPENTGRLHLYVSIAFFTLLAISLLVMGIAVFLDGDTRWKLGLPILLAGMIAGGVWVLPWKSAAIPEMTSALSASTISLILGIRMLKESF